MPWGLTLGPCSSKVPTQGGVGQAGPEKRVKCHQVPVWGEEFHKCDVLSVTPGTQPDCSVRRDPSRVSLTVIAPSLALTGY